MAMKRFYLCEGIEGVLVGSKDQPVPGPGAFVCQELRPEMLNPDTAPKERVVRRERYRPTRQVLEKCQSYDKAIAKNQLKLVMSIVAANIGDATMQASKPPAPPPATTTPKGAK